MNSSSGLPATSNPSAFTETIAFSRVPTQWPEMREARAAYTASGEAPGRTMPEIHGPSFPSITRTSAQVFSIPPYACSIVGADLAERWPPRRKIGPVATIPLSVSTPGLLNEA